jgi:hypothetical protein
MGEPSGPLPVITDQVMLITVSQQVIAEIRKAQDLIRRDLAARGDLIELMAITARLAEMERAYRRGTMLELNRAALEAPPPLAVVPEPRRGRHRSRRSRRLPVPGEGQLRLLGIAAAAALAPHWRHAVTVLKGTRAGHFAAKALAVHGPVKAGIAAAAASGGAVALAVTGAVVIHSATSPGGLAPAGAAPAASIYAASPLPSSSLIGSSARAREAARKKASTAAVAASQPPSWWYVVPPSSQPSASPSSSPPAASGPAVLTVSTTAIDLTSGNPVTITVSASGAGWASWKIDTTDPLTGLAQGDLDFSKTSGVLAAGQSVTITVSLDPAQAQDGNLAETFTIAGVSVRATLPAAVPQPSATDSPSVAPTAPPT